MRLEYGAPAERWTDALPLGNGRIGAMVFGGTSRERVQLNDDTCWSGGPRLGPVPTDGKQVLEEVRRALMGGDVRRAERASQRLQFGYVAAYQPLVDLWVDDASALAPDPRYRRGLLLDQAVATSSWSTATARSRQEAWTSHPDGVFVLHRRVVEGEPVNLRISVSCPHPHEVETGEESITLRTKMPHHVDPQHAAHPRTQYRPEAGTVSAVVAVEYRHDGVLVDGWVHGASEVLIVLATATDYAGPATPLHGDLAALTAEAHHRAAEAAARGAQELRDRHVADYRALWDRFSIELPSRDDSITATDVRLRRCHDPREDPALAALLVNFGRYLTISSSRPGTRPSNLQGIWNDKPRPPWSSNYTLNINLAMNYWLPNLVGLRECSEPLIDFIAELAESGRLTAEALYGAPGWVAHHNSDAWAFSLPAGEGDGDPAWSMWPLGGIWLATHLWEQWQFNRDEDELRTRLLPPLLGAAEFAEAWLVEFENGTLGTVPSTSPENHYVAPDGDPAGLSTSTTSDLEMIRAVLTAAATALEVTGDDPHRVKVLQKTASRLPETRIGSDGRLAEWSEDLIDAEPTHRHQSHLFGVMPGESLVPWEHPELIAAARRSLDARGEHSTGWSLAWRVALRARMEDAEGALVALTQFLRPMEDGASDVPSMTAPSGLYRNLFSAHPPFQVDGNFGAAAAVLEMIVQSHGGRIRLLPALPDSWHTGSVRGIQVRGGARLELSWDRGEVSRVSLASIAGGQYHVVLGERSRTVDLSRGETWVGTAADFT